MSWDEDFLSDREPRSWTPEAGFPKDLKPLGLFFQESDNAPAANGLEVALAEATTYPSVATVRKAWANRQGKRASPVLLIVAYPADGGLKAAVCGGVSGNPRVFSDVDLTQAAQVAAAALSEPTSHAANRTLNSGLAQLDPPLPWVRRDVIALRNSGLVATHELHHGVPDRADWADACEWSRPLLGKRGRDLVQALGFGIKVLANNVSVLTVAEEPRAVALFCNDDESYDTASTRLGGSSPVSRALAAAGQDTDNPIDWVVLTRASEIRLYAARPNTGVGRKGRGETFVELNLAALAVDPKDAGYLHLLFSAEALTPETGSVEEILRKSERFAADLAYQLRKRVYFETVPHLANAVAERIRRQRRHPELTEDDLRDAYEQVMFILFRILFLAYAEATDLLPYTASNEYTEVSLTRIVQSLRKNPFKESSTKLWDGVLRLWATVNDGDEKLGVAAYNGGLFSTDADTSPTGARIAKLAKLSDAEFGPALTAMFIDETPEGLGPIDFRSLSVREFGTLYEGLLESRLAVAQEDDPAEVKTGKVYCLNRSGDRKESGSYFTKQFAVEHLLDHALEPALTAHIKHLSKLAEVGDDAGVAKQFFDFRCADIAMGSGHFLVAALDRIESRLSAFLVDTPVPKITEQLERLRAAAHSTLKDEEGNIDIETSSLLRRQVARHCVYGVDKNQIAVELARVSIWIHTFVPGLPLSFLDHNLVCGDSLTGVGTLEEVAELYEGSSGVGGTAQGGLFLLQLEKQLAQGKSALTRLAHTSGATKDEIADSHKAHREALEAVLPVCSLCNIVTAKRDPFCNITLPEKFDKDIFLAEAEKPSVRKSVADLIPLHFPAIFPEVFLRNRPGFDCILGNPPWEKVKISEDIWWAMYIPGLKALPMKTKARRIVQAKRQQPDLEIAYDKDVIASNRLRELLKTSFPSLGPGDTDLYRTFCWRKWQLTRLDGYSGIVLPRSALQGKNSQAWRQAVLSAGSFTSVVTLINTDGWVFDDIHRQYIVALVALQKSVDQNTEMSFGGPYNSLMSLLGATSVVCEMISTDEFLTWSDDASFPSIPDDPRALRLFRKLRRQPRLDGLDSRSSDSASSDSATSIAGQGRAGQGSLVLVPMQRFTQRTTNTCSYSTMACPPFPRARLDDGLSALSESSTRQTTSTDSLSTEEPRQ